MKGIDKARADLAASKASGEHDDFMKNAGQILVKAMAFKKALQVRNLSRGKAKCPFCVTGHWHGTLNGRKQHLHMACDGCTVQVME
jgi:hypothetical protein